MTEVTGRVLLVDDETAFQRVGGAWLRGLGHEVFVAGDEEEAGRVFGERGADVVLLDLVMPPRMTPQAGLAMIERFGDVPVVVLTGHAQHEIALRAVAAGAWDFVGKPVEPDMLGFVVGRAIAKGRLEREVRALRALEETGDMGLVGRSVAMERVREMVRRVGPAGVSVTILGPTGTGKELVARAVHACSKRAGRKFVAVHCGALAPELLESELFGHVKGAFTGAHRDNLGLLEMADGGTLFLDEVGEMPAAMQVKLLRFLQEGTFFAVGGRVEKRSDVRIVAATHRDLEGMVATGGFREDFYYRLKGILLRTPGLDERRDDVLVLAVWFLRRVAPKMRLSEGAAAVLMRREWPGNVRELRGVVEAAAALAGAGVDAVDENAVRLALGEMDGRQVEGAQLGGSLNEVVAAVERRMIRETLEACEGNQSEAARKLGISRLGLMKKRARLGLG